MSGGLAPSKSTVYVSNLPYELTNSDLHQIFEKYGKVAKVTIMRDKVSRESKGVAFVLYVDRTSAHKAIMALNRKELFGRTIKCSVARDNGRAAEFIRRKTYKDKTRCYECGEFGHLSFQCPRNVLGDRAQPEKKKKKSKKSSEHEAATASASHDLVSDEEAEDDDDWTLSDAVRYCQQMRDQEDLQLHTGHTPSMEAIDPHGHDGGRQRRHLKPDSYFSDEDASDQECT